MIFAKFVTNELKSPGRFRKLDYSNFGVPIEVKADSAEKGQCARGIHVFPVLDNIDFENVVFSEKVILLEVADEDIIFSNLEKTGKMRVNFEFKVDPNKISPYTPVCECDNDKNGVISGVVMIDVDDQDIPRSVCAVALDSTDYERNARETVSLLKNAASVIAADYRKHPEKLSSEEFEKKYRSVIKEITGDLAPYVVIASYDRMESPDYGR
jgi:hypothetical protein